MEMEWKQFHGEGKNKKNEKYSDKTMNKKLIKSRLKILWKGERKILTYQLSS